MKTRAGWLNTSQATEHLELLEAEQPIATAGKQLEEEEEEGRGKRRVSCRSILLVKYILTT